MRTTHLSETESPRAVLTVRQCNADCVAMGSLYRWIVSGRRKDRVVREQLGVLDARRGVKNDI